MEQGNAIQLSVVLFLSAYNRCADGCTAADKQQSNPQQKIGVISRLRRLVGAGFDGAAGQLCRHGGSLGDFLYCRSIGEILLAAVAVPIRNVAFFGNGGGLCVNVFQVGVVVRVRAAVACLANLTDGFCGAGRRAAVAILGFRMAGVTFTDSGVGLFIAILRPSAPVVVQRIAGEEGRLIRRALGAQTADCAGLVVDRLFRAGGGGFQVLCIHGLRREAVGQLFAILSLAKLTDGLSYAGCHTTGAVFCFHGVAGAAAAVGAVVIRCPHTPIVGMFVTGLGLEHRQGLTRCGHILALAVPWVFAISAAIDEQRQHRAVAKLRGSLGAGGFIHCAAIVPDGLCGCGIQIIAVSYGAFGYADNTADIACSCPCRRRQRPYAVAVGYGGVGIEDVAHDTAPALAIYLTSLPV